MCLSLILGIGALAIDLTHNFAVRAADQGAVDSAALSAAQRWHAEVISRSASGPPFSNSGTVDDAVRIAQSVAAGSNLATQPASPCVTSSISQLDVVYYDRAPACPSPPAGWSVRVEVAIPPVSTSLPAACAPTWTCVQVSVTHRQLPRYFSAVAGAPGGSVTVQSIASADLPEPVHAAGGNVGGSLGDGTSAERDSPVAATNLFEAKAIGAGFVHSLALAPDGTVWSWGDNSTGELGRSGDGSTPAQVVDPNGTGPLRGVAAISTFGGTSNNLALRSDGTVLAWGDNSYGQLGNGTTTSSSVPIAVQGLSRKIRAVSMGSHTGYALASDGTVWSWGNNDVGELGNGTCCGQSSTPVQVVGLGGSGKLTGVSAISGGGRHCLALRSDGTVVAWGLNFDSVYRNSYFGQLGSNVQANSSVPTQVVGGLSHIKAIAAGTWHSLALRDDGTVWAWGSSSSGQIGNGGPSGPSVYIPTQVVGVGGTGVLANAIAISAGLGTSGAVRADGTVVSWGYNGLGAFGAGTTTGSSTPVQASGLTNVTAIATGGLHQLFISYPQHWQANPVSGWAGWLYADYSNVGSGQEEPAITPTATRLLMSAKVVTGSLGNAAAIAADGSVWTWGLNNYGQLGNGYGGNTCGPATCYAPQQVPSFGPAIDVTQGSGDAIAVESDGAVWGWGDNSYTGQLGISGQGSYVPVAIPGPGGSGQLSGVVRVSSSAYHTLALRSDGTIVSWGANANGQLGHGTSETSGCQCETPGVVLTAASTPLRRVIAVSAGYVSSLALTDDGTVWIWGLHTAPSVDVVYAQPLAGISMATSLSAGGVHNLARNADGTVMAWGTNSAGQLGDGSTAGPKLPLLVHDSVGTGTLTGVTGVAAGGGDFSGTGSADSFALLDDGSVNAWGDNSTYMLGTGGPSTTLPVAVPGAALVTQLASSFSATWVISYASQQPAYLAS